MKSPKSSAVNKSKLPRRAVGEACDRAYRVDSGKARGHRPPLQGGKREVEFDGRLLLNLNRRRFLSILFMPGGDLVLTRRQSQLVFAAVAGGCVKGMIENAGI